MPFRGRVQRSVCALCELLGTARLPRALLPWYCTALVLIRNFLIERQTIAYEHKPFPTSFYDIKDRNELYWSVD